MPMKTIEGYSKEKYTDTSVLLAGGGAKALSGFIGSLTWDSTNKKITYTPVGGSATDLVTLSWDNISGKPSSFTPSTHSHTDISQKWTTYAGKEYIGWVKIIEWTLNTSNQMPALGFQLHLYRSYSSPSPESYSFDFKSSWGNSGIQIQQLNGSTGNQIINKLRFIRDDTNHKLYLEYYVNTSYSTYRNTVTVQVFGFGTGTPITNGLVQTEAEADIVVVTELTINATGASISGTISNAALATTADTVKVASQSTNASHYLVFVDSNNSSATAESLYTDGGLVYNPSTNILTITSSSGQQKEVTVTRTGGSSISLMVGTSNANHGLYSNTASKWMVYSDASGNVTLNGNAATATSASKVKTVASTATANHYLTFVDSNNSTAAEETVQTSSKLYIQPSTGNIVTNGYVAVGTGGANSYIASDTANNIYLRNSSGAILVCDANVVRRGVSLSTGQLGDTTYPWAEVHATKYKTANYELSESTNSRLAVGSSGQTTAKGLNVGDLLVSSAWADYTKVPTNGIYSKGQIKSGVAQGTAPFLVDSSTLVSNLNADYLDGEHEYDLRSQPKDEDILFTTLPMLEKDIVLKSGLSVVATPGDGPYKKCWLSTSYVTYYSDYFWVRPGDRYRLETWIMKPSDATGTNGTLYIGVERFDVNDKAISNNNGCYYLSGMSNATIPADGVWYRKTGTFTVPETHTVYSGSTGKGVYKIRIRCLINYSAGTSPLYWAGFRIYRRWDLEDMDGILPISMGGTDASTAAGARANLGTWALVNDSYPTLMPADGTTNNWVKIGTSNTGYGIIPSAPGNAGGGHNSIGTSSWYWKHAYIDEIHGTLKGNADTADYADAIRDPAYYTYSNRRASGNITYADGALHYFLATATMTTGKPAGDGHILHMSWDNGKYEGQLVLPTSDSGSLQWRTQGNVDDWKAWKTVLDSDNYTSYTVKKDGTGASGTWGISVTGSAGSVAWGNVTGKPDSFTPASHSHTFAATTSKITNTNEFNFVDAEQTIIWFNYRRASGSSATTATTQFRFSQGTASEAYAKVLADGFIKNGSSSSYVLLGDGGHKPVSDFATSGNYWPLATESYPYLRPGTSNNWIKIGSANDSYGLLPSQAGGAGSGHNYLGTSSWYWKYAYIDNVTVASNLTASGTVVFSGLNQGTSAPTDETEFLTSYAGTGGFANTTGAGKVYRRSMSLLWDYISDKIGDNYYKLGRNSNNLNITTTTWNGILPINAFGFRHGKAVWMYSDLDNVTSASWYNGGSGSGTVTVMTDAEALADNSSYTPSGNSSGKVLKIEPTGSIVSNKIGGTAFRTVTAKDNAVWLQVIRAWLPVGASITAAMNGTGTGRSYYWITSKEGTGKWEWYACLHINGHGGTMSTFGHTYATLSGAAIGVKWYIASFQIYELTNNNYDSLRSRYADSASAVPWSGISDIPSTFTPASHNHAAGDITSGTLGVARGGTGKASWTQYGLVYASATTTLAQVSQTWAASKTYWLKAVTNASKVPTYSFVDSLTSDKVTITYDSTGTDYKYVTFTDGQDGEQFLKAHYNLEYIPAIGSLQPYLLNGYRTAGYGVYLCRYYKSGGSSTGYVTTGPTGAGIVNGASASGNFSGTDTKVEDGKHTITLTNGTKSYWYVWPVLQVHYNITGSQDDCMEFGWANFYDSSSTGVKNVSPGGTVSFTFCCGRIHCQGSWAAKDYVRLTDTPGITITFFGSQAY